MQKLATYLVRGGPFATPDAVGWVCRLAGALAVIHRVGVAHGRVSAKAVRIAGERAADAGFLLEGEGLTDEPSYHSPERLGGAGTSPEDDTWAVGVILYQLLTGALPFPGRSPDEVRAEILASHAVPLAARGVKDACLERVVDELFAPERDARLVSLEQLSERLVECVPSCAGLPPVKLGKPEELPADDLDDQETEQHDLSAVRASRRPRLSPAAAGLVRRKESSKPPRISELDLDEPAAAATSEPGQLAAVAGADIFGSVPPPPPGEAGPAASPPPPPRPSAPPELPTSPPLDPQLVAPMAEPPPARGRKRLALLLAGIALVLAAVAVGIVLVWRGGEPPTAEVEPRAAEPNPAVPPSVTSAASPSTGPAPAHSSASTAASPAPSAAARPVARDLPTCMGGLFPDGTFAEVEPRFDFVCTETHARRGGTALKVEVVRTGGQPGKLPPAMQEWAKLGWYEMAVFAVARRRCCQAPAPLATPLGIDLCPLDARLEQLGRAAVQGDERALEQAIDDYTEVPVAWCRPAPPRRSDKPSRRPRQPPTRSEPSSGGFGKRAEQAGFLRSEARSVSVRARRLVPIVGWQAVRGVRQGSTRFATGVGRRRRSSALGLASVAPP